MYKLIALDMDGTLLNNDKTISEENKKAIGKAKKLGVKIVLATGRPIKGIKKYLKQLNLISDDDYAIAFGGALVQNTKSETVLSKTNLNVNDWNYLFALSKKLEVNIQALTATSCYTPVDNEYSQFEVKMNDIPLVIGDIAKLDPATSIAKIMFIDKPSTIDRIMPLLPKEIYERYTVVRSSKVFLEFLDKVANKGYGVKVLAKKLNISQNEIICIGDAGNDTHMIEYAGLGVAMENAFPEIKEIANFVTLSNENAGVAHVINKFILDKAV